MIKLTDLQMYMMLELTGIRLLSRKDLPNNMTEDVLDSLIPQIFQKEKVDEIKSKKDQLAYSIFNLTTVGKFDPFRNDKDPKFYKFHKEFVEYSRGLITDDKELFVSSLFSLCEDTEIKFNDSYLPFLENLPVNKKNKINIKRKNFIKGFLENNLDCYPILLNQLINNSVFIYSYYDFKECLMSMKSKYVNAKNLDEKSILELDKKLITLMDKFHKPQGMTSGREYNESNLSTIVDYFNIAQNMTVYKHVEKNILRKIGVDETLRFNLKDFFQTKANKNKEMSEVLNLFEKQFEIKEAKKGFELQELFVLSYKFSDDKAVGLLSKYDIKVSDENINILNVELADFMVEYFKFSKRINAQSFARSKSYHTIMFDSKEDLSLFKEFTVDVESVLDSYFNLKQKVELSYELINLEEFDVYVKKKVFHDKLNNSMESSDDELNKKSKIKI